MAVHSRTRFRSDRSPNIWPGFVDALATLLLVIVFLLSISALAQFFLGQTLSGRDQALDRLNREIAELQTLLGLERTASEELRLGTAQLSTSLMQASQARDVALANADKAVATAEKLGGQLAEEKSKQAEGAAQSATDLDTLNQQITTLKDELQRLGAALGAAELRDQENQKTVRDLGQRLNRALAVKVLELARYRSEFFGRLKSVLGDRAGIAIEGDRFILQSEVLFPSGSAELAPEGAARLAPIAATLLEIAPEIPADVKWILRVDGHTDQVPIRTGDFPSNWELSAARALSVVYYMIQQGVPAERLSAAGFGEFHPRDARRDEIGNRRNRRIELKLTRR
jgi:chemotaxis protein MotB